MSAPARGSAAAPVRASWDRVTTALGKAGFSGRDSGSWTKCCCPVHESDGRSHSPSLGVKYLADAGRTKVQCFAGCPDTLILDTLGLQVSDLYDEPLTRSTSHGRGPGRARPAQRPQQVSRADRAIAAAGLPQVKPSRDYGRQTGRTTTVATYTYTRADGQVEGEVTRKHTQHEHGRKKDFYQRRWNAQTGQMEPGGFSGLPFQLPEVLAAVAEGRTIYVAEGEEDVLALARAGVPATCNAAGAGKWRAEHAQYLRGARRVVVIADRDAPGFRHADKVAESLAGLVGEVRIVQARGGKDFRDHVLAGYELGELDPVPGLDYRTPIPPDAGSAGVPFAGEAALDSAGTAASPTHPPHPEINGGTPDMGEISGLGMNDQAQHQHDDSVDRIGSHFSQIVRLLMSEIMNRALTSHRARQAAAEEWRKYEDKQRRALEAQRAAQLKTSVTAMVKAQQVGWDRLSRTEVAAILEQAVSWSPDSEHARRIAGDLVNHIRERWDVHVDLQSGQVTVEGSSPAMIAKMAAAEQDRAAASRLATAQDRMVAMIAAESLDESVKVGLYAQIEEWRKAPSPQGLSALTKKMADAGVGEKTRTRAQFVALYLGEGASGLTPVKDLGGRAASAAAALRKMPEPLVDPGEEVKNRIDTLLLDYQSRLKHGLDTVGVQARLAEAVEVMTEADQKTARDRGKAIRANPAAEFKPLWPNHVDRADLAATVRTYAALAPTVESRVASPDGLDPQWAVEQRDRAAALRKKIDKAIKTGKGLDDLERDQLRAVLTDVEAGRVAVPDVLLADDRSVAQIDRDRADEIGHEVAYLHRRDLEEILATSAAPEGTARTMREDIKRLQAEQTRLAAGRISLRDYEGSGADEKLLAGLIAHGVPESVRNQVRKHLDDARQDMAITGRQASVIQDRWADRREEVATARAPKEVDYDSPERRARLEYNLQRADLTPDEIRQCMAADAGRAKPPSAAVQAAPAERPVRLTTPGAGVQMQQDRHHAPDQDLGIGA
jgi:hypothetical protein